MVELRTDPKGTGLPFDAFVIRDLRIHAQLSQGAVDSWRDSNGSAETGQVTGAQSLTSVPTK